MKKLLSSISEIVSAAILSVEGLPIASALHKGIDETRIATMTVALLSLTERSVIELNRCIFE